MDFTNRHSLMLNPELHYLQAAAMIAMQQKLSLLPLQLQQNLLLANLFRQKEAQALSQTEQAMRQMMEDLTQQQITLLPKSIKIEEPALQLPTSMVPKVQEVKPSVQQTLSKSDIRSMVHFLLNNIGIAEEKTIEEARTIYSKDPLLSGLFDNLMGRYNTTIKTKEEMVKYTLRKALRWLRLKVAKGKESDPKEGMKILIQRYFGGSYLEKKGLSGLNDDQVLDKFLPFKKESRIKTMNTSFVAELFESQEFTKDYQEFLKGFYSIIVTDNDRKIEKFIKFLEECYSKKSFDKLKNFKRIPWLKCWVNNTMNQARDLPHLGNVNRENQQSKSEESVSESYEPKLEKKVKIEEHQSEPSSIQTE